MSKVPRPTRPALSREYILGQALDLLDCDGLEAFSMRRLGVAVGADPMAIYHYFPNQAALFDGIVETLYLEVDLGASLSETTPIEQVVGVVRSLRRTFLSHPKVLPLVATRPANTPALYRMIETFLEIFARAGVKPSQALDTITCLTVFTIGHALAQAGEPVGGESPIDTAWNTLGPIDLDRQFEAGLKALIDGMLLGFGR